MCFINIKVVNTINTRNASALYYVTHNNSTHDKGRVIYLQKLMLTPSPSLPDPQWKKKISYLMDYHAQFRLRSSKQLTQITQTVWIC